MIIAYVRMPFILLTLICVMKYQIIDNFKELKGGLIQGWALIQ